ncbi:ferredoxin family protein [Clostridiales Family XIII bacterium ASD5510]|uniref:Ferredoxin family protein n=1 Tax=Hominibacterium faecale TaxID=2839743 RepID=A0A9J6QV06_9FIRM|nr:ferredoxin family protein [Hominibacterium faecale]MCU7378939.1 ferredoxin family protein [Hominibacterium faecale]
MAKSWYPMIDIEKCAVCGRCVKQCPNGVYEEKKTSSPVIIHPENCMDHCHGCGNLCPQGAITYFGDDTGWRPPNKKQDSGELSQVGQSQTEKTTVKYRIPLSGFDIL